MKEKRQYIDVINKKICSGCGACVGICPKKALSLSLDGRGNVYPKVNQEICVNCGLCANICNYKNIEKKQYSSKECYAAVSKNKSLLNSSSSGGAFSTIAKSFIEDGGIVCGCTMEYTNDKLRINHIIVESINDLYKIQGSKYSQSDITKVLPTIKKLLESQKKVLFSGTPCQIIGLKSYLKKDYNNLFTIDLVCHGAPNQKLFHDYINFLEKKKNISITNFIFRDKSKGWENIGKIEYVTKKGKYKKKVVFSNESSYFHFFEKGYFFRECCYNCKFAGFQHPADITIGDYWGIKNVHPELIEKINIKAGVSCLIVNNSKGTELLDKYGQNIELYKSSIEKIKKYNSQLNFPHKKPEDSEYIYLKYTKDGYEAIEKEFQKKYGNICIIKIKNRLKYFIKKVLGRI